MQLTFTIPDEKKDLFLEAWSTNWRAEIPDPEGTGEMIPNPQNKAQFAKSEIKAMMVQRVKTYEANQLPEIGIT